MTTDAANPNLPGSQPVKTAGEHAKDFDANGQPVHAAEPGDGADAVESGAPIDGAATPAAPTETPEQIIKRKSFKDDVRADIAAKRSAMTLEERQAFAKEDPAEFSLSEQIAGGDGVIDGEDGAAAPAAPGVPAAPAIASDAKTYKVRVYGKDVAEVGEAEVIQAGIRSLQKESAADIRMNQAATRETQLVEWEGQLQSFANNLAKGLDKDGRPLIPAGGPGNPQPPVTGVAGAIDKAKLQQAQAALLRGDDEVSSTLMAEIIQTAVAASRPATEVEPRKVEVPARPAGVGDPWGTEQRKQANAVFNDEFMDLSDGQFALAQTQMNALMANPANKGIPLVDLARNAGVTVRQALGPTAPPPAPTTPTQQVLNDRRSLKARIPLTPPAGNARAPNSQPAAPRFPTASEHVRLLQMRNGSNSSPRK